MTEPDDDLTIDIQLRPIDEVAHRMVILAALVQVALTLSDEDDERLPETIEQELSDLADALLIGDSADFLTEQERNLLESEWLYLDEESIGEMLWRVEALDVLNWATTDPPIASNSPWLQADALRLISTIPAPWDEIEPFLSTRQFRTESDIAAFREATELWVWRGAVDEELGSTSGGARSELLSAIRETAEEADREHLIDSLDGDFLAGQFPYHRAPDEMKAVIVQVAFQRLWALNWLCGFGDSWDDVPLDI